MKAFLLIYLYIKTSHNTTIIIYTHLYRMRMCGNTLAWNCSSRTGESNLGSSHDLAAARSNATGSMTLQQECLRPV